MSGPLASWVLAHTKAEHPAERFVLVALALRCNHDGVGEATNEQLGDDTGHHDATVRAALLAAIGRKELERLKRGAAGHPSRYAFATPQCVEPADCPMCALLASQASKTAPETRFRGGRRRPKSASETSKSASETLESASQTRPNGNGDGSPLQGEPSPPGESDDARSSAPPRRGSAARSGSKHTMRPPDPATARRELADRETTEAAAAAIWKLDDPEVVARWQQSADAPRA